MGPRLFAGEEVEPIPADSKNRWTHALDDTRDARSLASGLTSQTLLLTAAYHELGLLAVLAERPQQRDVLERD